MKWLAIANRNQRSVKVYQGERYRLSQSCFKGMKDKWQDQSIKIDKSKNSKDIETEYVKFIGGVYNTKRNCWYPDIYDGENRRVGMLNFFFVPPSE